ncbi:Retrovirus-related Pol Polyprotein from transposon TNT 1-94 [Phytophthora megakarya]|uniref:Retrovirus-related Pol Polyprotein from transposon TNT 1-94 n=1 Tax=Phytophthora megakarya TaxID=4795 RepID=A0A225WM30_9STRA|nr:Retrovirus-related Pol Polyprotein from transposon TNT 1-94 [Phytophthora megakarya]
MKELGIGQNIASLFIDNQSTIKVCSEAGNFDGVKLYAKKSRKIAELVEKKKIKLEYVPTSENIADMFTKAL